MNDVGNRVAIGSHKGYVKVYELVGGSNLTINQNWNQIGADIIGNDNFGYSLDLNGARCGGNWCFMAYGSNPEFCCSEVYFVEVYKWNGTSWSQLGTTINGESTDTYFGTV